MNTSISGDTRRLFWLYMGGFLVFGAVFTIIGAALPQIIHTFHWSYALTGTVLAASAVGYFVSSFFCGLLVQRFPPKAVIIVGLLVGAAGMVLFARTSSPWLNLLFNLAIGLCQGAIEVVTNLGIVRMEKPGQSRLMNLLHAGFSVGAIAGPLSIGYLIGRSTNGTVIVFTVAGILAAVMAILFSTARFPAWHRESSHQRRGSLKILQQPLLLLIVFFIILYVGAEVGVSSWTSEFFVTVLGSPASIGAFAVALFWTGLLVGRLIVSLYRGTRQEYIVLASVALATVALTLALVVRSTPAVAVGVFLTGLGFAGIYPLVMSMVGRYFKSGFAIGVVATGGGIGSFTFPFIMAVLAQTMGLRNGFWFYLGICGVLVALSLVFVQGVKKLPGE
jgi:fucose permease